MGVSFVGSRTRDGDRESFAWFFATEYPEVVRTVSFVVHDRAAAEDLTQEAFIRLHLRWAKVSRYERPDAWVRRVALNLALSHRRREGRRADLEALSTGARAPVLFAGADDRLDVLRALRTLSMRERALVVLYHLEDRPLDEVAALLDMSPGAAKVALHRARRRLAQCMQPSDVTP